MDKQDWKDGAIAGLAVVSVLFTLQSCSSSTDSTGRTNLAGIEEVCLNGVVYYRTMIMGNGVLGASLTPKYKPTGFIETCRGGNSTASTR